MVEHEEMVEKLFPDLGFRTLYEILELSTAVKLTPSFEERLKIAVGLQDKMEALSEEASNDLLVVLCSGETDRQTAKIAIHDHPDNEEMFYWQIAPENISDNIRRGLQSLVADPEILARLKEVS